MKCKNYETLLLRSFDGLLRNEEKKELEKHLETCLPCQTKRKEYQSILDALKEKGHPEPAPYFWERLQPKLKDGKKYLPLSLWKQWGIKAIPLSLFLKISLICFCCSVVRFNS